MKNIINKITGKNNSSAPYEQKEKEVCNLLCTQQNPVNPKLKELNSYSMSGINVLENLNTIAQDLEQRNIEGDFVECGVWKGGSVMAVTKTLLASGVNDRELYLYDTFEAGMTMPDSGKDISLMGMDAKSSLDIWESANSYPTLDDVKKNVLSTDYPSNKIKFVKGDVMQTLLNEKPKSISILRLDTDWYQTTKFELEQLFPLLVSNGILIIDDYGHWKGAREAVYDFFTKKNQAID